MKNNDIQVSVVLPCLNEEQAVGVCIKKIQDVFDKHNIAGEIIVVDNGSTDKSAEIASGLSARVAYQQIKGYGAAYIKGINESNGKYIVIGDADDTYDFYDIPMFIEILDRGYDLVMGSRFKGKMAKGAMSWSHKFIGNPIITFVFETFFHTDLSDVLSGMRAFTKDAYYRMKLKCLGMEFGTEMIFSALQKRMKIAEIPINYYPRKGQSKLNSFQDAWRYFRFMLLFSPDWLFLVPGLLLFFGGLAALLLSGWGKLVFLGHRFDIHGMVFFTIFALMGFQIINLGFFAKSYSYLEGFIQRDKLIEKIQGKFDLEKGIFIGGILSVLGLIICIYIFAKWAKIGFGALNEVKLGLLGLLCMILGIQIVFSSFFFSLLNLRRKKDD